MFQFAKNKLDPHNEEAKRAKRKADLAEIIKLSLFTLLLRLADFPLIVIDINVNNYGGGYGS